MTSAFPLWYLSLVTSFKGPLSPPAAMAAFYLKRSLPPNVTLIDIYWGMGAFMGLQVIGLFVVYFFPIITTLLPKLAFG
jgi:TRAP-type mannitol/chloroaromatic compound transport system permease large subunit